MTQNKIFSFLVIGIIALALGIFIGAKIVSPKLAPLGAGPATISPAEDPQGQVVLVGTKGIYPDNKNIILRTDYYSNQGVGYIGINFTDVQVTNYTQVPLRACFGLKYYNPSKVLLNPQPPIGTGICLGPGDSGFAIEVLKVSQALPGTGRATIVAPKIYN